MNIPNLTVEQRQALSEIKSILMSSFPVKEMVLFGSTARGEAYEDSDVDVLVLTAGAPHHRLRDSISDVVFDANLKYSTNVSVVVVDHNSWNSGPHRLLPLHREVTRDGVRL